MTISPRRLRISASACSASPVFVRPRGAAAASRSTISRRCREPLREGTCSRILSSKSVRPTASCCFVTRYASDAATRQAYWYLVGWPGEA